MSRYYSHINSAQKIIEAYTGAEPFASHLKKQFAANKKFGSKDRKQITQLCYGYFRLGNSLKDSSVEEKLVAGLFLSSRNSNELLQHLKPEWNDVVETNREKKVELLNSVVDASSVFPFTNELSEGIDMDEFAFSHLQQPDLFLRIRPGRKDTVLHQLKAADVSFRLIGENTVALPNATKIEETIMLNKDAVVQDYSSQSVQEFMIIVKENLSETIKLPDTWQVGLFHAFGGELTADSGWGAKMWYGACWFLPIYAVVFLVGGFWEVLFAMKRGHEVNEGFFGTAT